MKEISDAGRGLLGPVVSRLLIGLVLFWNLQCAIGFLIVPERYAWGFELQGTAGEAMVRGLGLLFLMWNVPYAVALWHPARHRLSLIEASFMQGIGLAGESLLLWALPAGHAALRATSLRFIAFDAVGLFLLVLAMRLTKNIGARTLRSGENQAQALGCQWKLG